MTGIFSDGFVDNALNPERRTGQVEIESLKGRCVAFTYVSGNLDAELVRAATDLKKIASTMNNSARGSQADRDTLMSRAAESIATVGDIDKEVRKWRRNGKNKREYARKIALAKGKLLDEHIHQRYGAGWFEALKQKIIEELEMPEVADEDVFVLMGSAMATRGLDEAVTSLRIMIWEESLDHYPSRHLKYLRQQRVAPAGCAGPKGA